jgi:hypothetical protein
MFSMDLLILLIGVAIFTVAYSLIFERDEEDEEFDVYEPRQPQPVRVDRR